MAQRGKLTISDVAHTMPAISPIFPRFPIMCKNVENISVVFETDRDSALAVLPDLLELPEPATAILNILRIPESAMGSFNEASLVLQVLWRGELCRYNILQFVTNDMALVLGREVLGSPKKLAHIEMAMRAEGMFGYVERPKDHRLLALGVSLDEAIDTGSAAVPSTASLGLRVLYHPEGETPEVTAELLETRSTWRPLSQWRGRGLVAFPAQSAIDDWAILSVREIKSALYSRFDIEIPRPRLLARMGGQVDHAAGESVIVSR